MGKIVFKCFNSGICVYTYYSILTCEVHASCKSATYINFIGFYTCFCMCADFYTFPFRQCNARPMTLPASDKQQCHHNVVQYVEWTYR